MKETIRTWIAVCRHASRSNVTFLYILVSEIVIWLWSRRITSSKMENVENSLIIDVIRPVNLPFNQEEMTLWGIRDETAGRTDNIEKMDFQIEDNDLRDTCTILKVRILEIWYCKTESINRQPVTTYEVQISMTFRNNNQTCIKRLLK